MQSGNQGRPLVLLHAKALLWPPGVHSWSLPSLPKKVPPAAAELAWPPHRHIVLLQHLDGADLLMSIVVAHTAAPLLGQGRADGVESVLALHNSNGEGGGRAFGACCAPPRYVRVARWRRYCSDIVVMGQRALLLRALMELGGKPILQPTAPSPIPCPY